MANGGQVEREREHAHDRLPEGEPPRAGERAPRLEGVDGGEPGPGTHSPPADPYSTLQQCLWLVYWYSTQSVGQHIT